MINNYEQNKVRDEFLPFFNVFGVWYGSGNAIYAVIYDMTAPSGEWTALVAVKTVMACVLNRWRARGVNILRVVSRAG